MKVRPLSKGEKAFALPPVPNRTPASIKQKSNIRQTANADTDSLQSPLPKAIKAVFRVVSESGQSTGRFAVESVNHAGETMLNLIDTTRLSMGHMGDIAQLASDADLYDFQNPKGLRELTALIQQADKPPAHVADRGGYYRVVYGGQIIESFVWRDAIHVVGGKEPTLALRVMLGMANFPPASGTLDEWKSEVGVHVVRNPYMLITVLAAMIALLGDAFGLPKLVLMFVGSSSLGKTTLMRVGLSLVTRGDPIETFAGTTKGVEAKLREYSDVPAFMDELRQADVPSDLVKLVFDIESEASRKVSSGSQQVIQRGSLRRALVIANESTLTEITSGSRVKINEGIGARLIEVHVQGPHGAFHVLPEGMTAKQFAEHLKVVTAHVYGIFWDVLVPEIAKNASKVREWLFKNLPLIEAELLEGLPVSDPVTARLVRGLAAWGCAGLLAVRFNLLDTDRKCIIAAIRLVLEQHLQRNVHGSHSVAEQVVCTLRSYIDQSPKKFPALTEFHSSNHSGIYGYRRGTGKDATYLILPSVFEKLLGEKFGTEAAARALKVAGYLKCKGVGYQLQVRIPGGGGEDLRKRFYAIDGSIRFDESSS
jgi:hypothetical protein